MNQFLSLLVALLVAETSAGSAKGVLPSVYTIIEDDYGYMCSCECTESSKRISFCEYDKATPCYCDV
jgi:hypothetical protein